MSGGVERVVRELTHVAEEIIEKLPHGHGATRHRISDDVHAMADEVDAAETKVARAVPHEVVSPHAPINANGASPSADAGRRFFGARGAASGRPFDPKAAGGPVRRRLPNGVTISHAGVQDVLSHLKRFVDGDLEGPEAAMVHRLEAIASGNLAPTTYDLNFYTHELDEAARYAALGHATGSLSGDDMYDVWNNAHTAALEDYGIKDADLYYPGTRP